MTVEQMCRDLLERAIADGLVFACDGYCPQEITASELTGMANMLSEFLKGGAREPVEAAVVVNTATINLACPNPHCRSSAPVTLNRDQPISLRTRCPGCNCVSDVRFSAEAVNNLLDQLPRAKRG